MQPDARVICWFSCGAASAVATKLALREFDPARVVVAYCETGAEHPDNERFLAACESWFGSAVTRLRSEEYSSTWDLWERRRFLSGVHGAICTGEMKVAPRLAFQRPFDVHVFGYTVDAPDMKRAASFRDNYPELEVRTPLIEAGLKKEACLALVASAGIALPALYGLGFSNNNCIPCVKATSPNYWALVRLRFPAEFARMATLSRGLGVRLARIRDERVFIDEIPADWPTLDPIAPACDFLCHLAEMDIAEAVDAA